MDGRGACGRVRRGLSGVAVAVGLMAAWTESLGQGGSVGAVRFFGTGANQQDRVRIAVDDNVPGSAGNTPLDVGAGSFSMELWVRGRLADNASAGGPGDIEYFDFRWIEGNTVLDRDIWGGSERDFGVSIAGGRVRFGTGRGDVPPLDPEHTLEGSEMVLTGEWRHVAVVREAVTGVKRIYVDGVLDVASAPGRSRADLSYPDSGDASPVTPWGPYLVIGAEKHDAGAAYPSFRGDVDEVRVWNRALTGAEVAAWFDRVLPPGTTGLVGSYRFEESAGTVVEESSGAGSPAGVLIAGVSGNGQRLGANDAAPVRPVCVADWDSSGEVEPLDVSAFFASYRAGVGDADGNGEVEPLDVSVFFAAYRGGCP